MSGFINQIKSSIEEIDFSNESIENEKIKQFLVEIKDSFSKAKSNQLLFGLKFSNDNPGNFKFFKLLISALILSNFNVKINEIIPEKETYSIIVIKKTT